MEFRRVKAEELEEAYSVVCEAAQWLLSKGITQWRRPLPRDIYASRQERGFNFGLWHEGVLAVVVSLTDDRPDYWGEDLPGEPFTWMATLASRVDMKGRDLGARAVCLAEDHVRRSGGQSVWLDCQYGGGFLPSYYLQLGFRTIRRKVLFGNPEFDSVLMTKELHSSEQE